MNQLISVIVPVCDSEQHTRECFDSIRNQTHKDTEILILERSPAAKSLCDEYIAMDRRFRRAENAIEEAKAEYIIFLRGHDFCSPEMLEYLLERMDSCDMAVCPSIKEDEKGNTFSRCDGISRVLDSHESIKALIENESTEIYGKLIKKELFAKADGDIFTIADTAAKTAFCPAPLYRPYENTGDFSLLLKEAAKAVKSFRTLRNKYGRTMASFALDSIRKISRFADDYTEDTADIYKEGISVIREFLKDELPSFSDGSHPWYAPTWAERMEISALEEFTTSSLKDAKKYRSIINKNRLLGDMGKISVIVPMYKVEKFLRKCMESILSQTYGNLEIILVDDGSPDRCGSIADEYAALDSRIIVIHKKNGGLCSARNSGLDIATGKYIGFIDPDDWASEDLYEYLIKGIRKYEAQVASCRYFRVIEGQEITARADGMDVLYNHQEMMKEFIERFIIRSTFWNKLFVSSLFETARFPEGRTYEGTYFMHEILENVNSLVSLGLPKYYYVDNEDSIVNDRSLKNVMNYVFAYIKRCEDLRYKYPHLEEKLLADVLKAIRSLTYVGYRSSPKDMEESRDDIKVMTDFISGNPTMLKNQSSAVKKEVLALGQGNIKGFKKARFVRAMAARKEKLREALFGKKKAKAKTAPAEITAELTPQNSAKLRRLQLEITGIIDEIDRICRKHGLRYYLYGGTLLGAIRHGGFIPWDDDADIVMPREDYDRFREICKTELGNDFFYQDSFTDPEFRMLFCKIRKNNTYVHEEKFSTVNMHKGIFADILPLDYFPKSKFWGKVMLHCVSMSHSACALDSCPSGSPIAKIVYKLGRIFPRSFHYKMRDRLLKFSSRHSSKENIASLGSHYMPMTKRVFKSDWFTGKERTLEFEGRQFSVPARYEEYILHLFGPDFMELPPPEKRICHTDFDRINFHGSSAPGGSN